MLGAIAVIAIVVWLVGLGNSRPSTTTGNTTSGSSSEVSGTGNSRDPIEQARVVLGGSYSYAQIKAATDAALSSTGTALTDENRSRAWSAVLSVTGGLTTKGYSVDAMAGMRCIPDLGQVSGMDFPDTAALCASDLALNP